MKRVRYYSSFQDDFERSANQDFRLPDDYQWVKHDVGSKFLSGLIYGLAVIFGGLYCRCFLHMKVTGRKNLKGMKDGFFLYGNHTQPAGDVFIPALCLLPRRIFTVVSPANYGIPAIGKLLPYLGALPTVNSMHGVKELTRAMEQRLGRRHPIVIYPEAHVWEYYTGIRPFPDTSFKFPVKFDKPAYAMTVTYRKAKLFKRPVMEVFLDGPFYPAGNTVKDKVRDLHHQVSHAMTRRSRASTYSYIEYRPQSSKA